MVESIQRLDAKLERMRFVQLEFLYDCEIQIELPRPRKPAALELADFSGIRIQESLTCKWRGPIRRNTPSITSDCSRCDDIRTLIRHPELQPPVELIFPQRRRSPL